MTRALELGRERLTDMERQRDELEIAIKGLREQLDWGDEHLSNLINDTAKAAE